MSHQVEHSVDYEQRQLPVQQLILLLGLAPGLGQRDYDLTQGRWWPTRLIRRSLQL